MTTPYLLAIDQGTTGTKVVLADLNGFIKNKSYLEISQFFPRPGWVEHDPLEILHSVYLAAEKAISRSGIKSNQIAAIGITNQRETVIVWDRKTGRPLHKAIVWQDKRTADYCESLANSATERIIRRKTGLRADPYFSATKIRWMIRKIPRVNTAVRKHDLRVGTVDAWLLWNLTGGKHHATDFTNASRTMLFDIRKMKWSAELLDIFNVPADCLPRVQKSTDLFGLTAKAGPFPKGIPIHAMAGDQQSALYGEGCYEPGDVKTTYGTGCFVMQNTGARRVFSDQGLLSTIACDAEGMPVYAMEGSVFIAGAAIQWMRDGLGLIRRADETEKIAKSVNDTGGVFMIPAFVGLGAPYWDSRCRGAILGLTRGTGRAHIVRAALESIAYQVADVVDAMKKTSGLQIREMKADGGASKNAFLMQFQSDLLGMTVKRSSNPESTAWGALKLAARGAGLCKDVGIMDRRTLHDEFRPKIDKKKAKRMRNEWLSRVERVLTCRK